MSVKSVSAAKIATVDPTALVRTALAVPPRSHALALFAEKTANVERAANVEPLVPVKLSDLIYPTLFSIYLII